MRARTGGDTPWEAGHLGRGSGRPRVLFGWSYEDERVELDAFGPPDPRSRVCVIAASGETAAACAAAGHRVVAVDLNPVQLAYAGERVTAQAPAVRGAAERGMAAGRRTLALVDPAWRLSRVRVALTGSTGAVADYWAEELDRRPLRWLLAGALRPGAALAGLLRPEFAAFVPSRFAAVLRRRIAAGLATHGAEQRFAWRLLAGVEQPGWVLPRPRTPISWQHADVATYLQGQPPGSFAGVSLSNVTDGASADFADRVRRAALRAVRPGGAVVSRSFAAGPLDAADAALLWGTVRVERVPPR